MWNGYQDPETHVKEWRNLRVDELNKNHARKGAVL